MRQIALTIATVWTLAASADILHLRDGSRYYGTLVSRSEREVVFRIAVDDGASTVVKRFPAELVKAVERGANRPGGATPPPPATLPVQQAEDFGQMLREAFELLDDGDIRAALRALQRVVVRAPPSLWPGLDAQCQVARGVPLADLLASVRIRDGLRGGGFRLRYATPYEASALGRLLEQQQDEFLAATFAGRSIRAWAADPAAYAELQRDARPMVTAARRAAGMLGARIQFDPRLKQDHRERQRLVALRAELARFVAHVTALPGYTEPVEEAEGGDRGAGALPPGDPDPSAASQPSRSGRDADAPPRASRRG